MDEYTPDNPEVSRSITSRDKLTYKMVVQSRVQLCLSSRGTLSFPRNVQALKSSIYFDVEGLKFKTDIRAKEFELGERMKDYLLSIEDSVPGTLTHPIRREFFYLKAKTKYHEDLFEYLVDLLATSKALFQTKDFVEMGFEE